MTLATYRDAVLADARRLADATAADAEREATARTDVAAARDEGARVAERAGARVRARARRAAQRRVLEARRAAYDALHARARAALAGADGDDPDARLEAALRAEACRQLGPGARVTPAPGGGVVAEADGRRVDYSLDAVVDRCIDALGSRVAELWS